MGNTGNIPKELNITVIHGPNLNMLGRREKSHYGDFSLADLEKYLIDDNTEVNLTFFQSNSEGELVSFIQNLKKQDGIVINAGAYTHTSIAMRDSFLSVQIPFVEVHISNVYSREDFRKKSYLADIAVGVISGLGKESYNLAIKYFISCKRP
ncbi:MAG: type II 3-dehydroquinate dehydratase [Leptospirales bacterium]